MLSTRFLSPPRSYDTGVTIGDTQSTHHLHRRITLSLLKLGANEDPPVSEPVGKSGMTAFYCGTAIFGSRCVRAFATTAP